MPRSRIPRNTNALVEFIKVLLDSGFENAGLYYSTYRAIVADRDDPENLQRLKLIIPEIGGMQAYEYWAHPKGVFFGRGYGSQVIPSVGDIVWVEFPGGRPEIPIWLHGHPARKEGPNEEFAKDKNTCYFVSPKGNYVLIDDTKNVIRVKSRFGDYMELNESSISLVANKAKKISLGKLNQSTYSAVLGEELKAVLVDLKDYVLSLNKAINTDAILSPGAYMGKTGHTTEYNSKLKPLGEGLEDKIDKILSKLNTLE